jgi:acetyl esterase
VQPEPDLATVFDGLDDGAPFDLGRARQGLAEMVALNTERTPVAEVADGTLAGVPVRTYRADGADDTVLVWLHGGGWVSGTLDSADALCRDLAVRSRAAVVSVDYRLAPEHPFPAALEDCLAVVRGVAGHDALVLAGESAGANVVTAAAHALRGEVDADALLLVSPVLDARLCSPSVSEFGTGHGLTAEFLQRFVAMYCGAADPADPRISPLLEPDLTGLPPAVVVTAGRDPLRDEAEQYVQRLRAAGVPVTARRWDGMVHGFHAMGRFTPCADEALDWAVDALRAHLRG